MFKIRNKERFTKICSSVLQMFHPSQEYRQQRRFLIHQRHQRQPPSQPPPPPPLPFDQLPRPAPIFSSLPSSLCLRVARGLVLYVLELAASSTWDMIPVACKVRERQCAATHVHIYSCACACMCMRALGSIARTYMYKYILEHFHCALPVILSV